MRVSVATKVFLGFVLVLLTSGLVSAYGVLRLHRVGEGLQVVSSAYFPLASSVGSLQAFQKERTRGLSSLLEERDPMLRRSLRDSDVYASRALAANLARLRDQVQSSLRDVGGAEHDSLLRIEARLTSLGERVAAQEQVVASVLDATAPLGRGAPSERPELQEKITLLGAAQRRVDYDLKALLDVLQQQMNRGVAQAEAEERAARWAIVGLSLLALGVGVLVTWLAQRALSPIRGLTEAAQRLGRGSPDAVAALPEGGTDELAVLAREFNAMAQRLGARERELKAQGEALLRSERLATIGRIAAQITHEIRNPLSAIGLNAEELAERLRDARAAKGTARDDAEAQAAALCDAIAREVDRLAAITEEYLRFARLPRPQPVRADVSELARDLLAFVRPELEASGVRAEAVLGDGLPEVLADVGQIRQLVLNLLRNAREAMPGGGRLTVRTRADEAAVVLEVRDTGPGIPPERLQRIFDPFFTTKERGTGLGLATAQEIAQEHGGHLTVESRPGAGTAFQLRLPAAPPLEVETSPSALPSGAVAPS